MRVAHPLALVPAILAWDYSFLPLDRGLGPLQCERYISGARRDEMHNAGEDLSAHLEFAKATHPGREVHRLNINFPIDLLHVIDWAAETHGVSHQASLKWRLFRYSRELKKRKENPLCPAGELRNTSDVVWTTRLAL